MAITPELVAAFKAYCQLLSPGPEYAACPFQLPFFHLRGDGVWHLHARPGRELMLTSSRSISSFGHLRDAVVYAALDPALWELVQPSVAWEEIWHWKRTHIAFTLRLRNLGPRSNSLSKDLRETQATACLKASETYRVLLLAVARKLAGSDEGGMDLFPQTLLNYHKAIQRHSFVGDRTTYSYHSDERLNTF